MSDKDNTFKFTMPAELSKGKDGAWVIQGLASTSNLDQQGESIVQKGIDTTPIDQGRGWLNFDHQPGVENRLGTLDSYKHTEQGLVVSGTLFKDHEKAKATYAIIKGLSEHPDVRKRKAVGMSVEGRVIARDPNNPKIITKCEIGAVALTFNPVNSDTYTELMKSMSQATVDFNSQEPPIEVQEENEEATFTATQVVDIVQKALSITDGITEAPNTRTGGDALVQSDLKAEDDDKDKKKKKKLKKTEMYKSQIRAMFDVLMAKYPEASKEYVWEVLKDKLNERF